MARIAVLPSAVADQIAAGEVVERPASVVKELVENALDAGASTVDITIEEGGRSLIRVADDGVGMDTEDAVMALSRHATSKITSAAQLVGVSSFGFRGEALPAIASVSELLLETSSKDGDGTQVRVRGGALVETSGVARRRGTTVSVQRLFFNTPARFKFMRGARSEWRSIVETVQAIAILRRDIHFRVVHDGRQALDLPSADSLRSRVAAIWGADDVSRFISVDDVRGVVHVSGLAERPADVGTATRRVLLVVNGRTVRDTGLIRAAEAAYRSTIPAGLRPSLVLQIRLPGNDVDVNVHPAKAEVRFSDRWSLERVVEEAVRRSLGVIDASAGIGWYRSGDTVSSTSSEQGAVVTDSVVGDDLPPALVTEVLSSASLHNETAEQGSFVSSQAPANSTQPAPLPSLKQWRRMYIAYEHADGVVLIDQHSAHERVLYEKFMGVLERGEAPSQRLLFPMTLHLNPREAEAFEQHSELFTKLGFDVQHFGGSTLMVQAVPMPHPRFDAEFCLRESLASLTGDRLAGTHARHEHLAATVACKAAIKAGDVLSISEMESLYRALTATKLPAHDVHGRSTIVRISWDEVDRRFGRK